MASFAASWLHTEHASISPMLVGYRQDVRLSIYGRSILLIDCMVPAWCPWQRMEKETTYPVVRLKCEDPYKIGMCS